MSIFESGTKNIGGGPARPLANDFVSFLQSGLNTGSFGSYQPRSTQRSGNALDQLKAFSGLGQNDAGTAIDRANPAGSTLGIGAILDKYLAGDFGNPGYSLDTGALKGFNVDLGDIGSPGTDAARTVLDRQRARDLADLRARFSYAGGGGLGTGASYAEGNYLAESGAQNANVLANLARQDKAFTVDSLLRSGQLKLDALARGLGLDSDTLRLQEGARQFDTASRGNVLQNILQLYAQLSGLGIPQAQTVVTPSFFDQLVKGASAGGYIYGNVKGSGA